MKSFRIVTGALFVTLVAAPSVFAHEVIHADHPGVHTTRDGHIATSHDGHVDHLHDGHLHHVHGDHVDEHVLQISENNPSAEEIVRPSKHKEHVHSVDDEDHPRIQHGDHFDFLHDGELHFVHGDHIDNHGAVKIVKSER